MNNGSCFFKIILLFSVLITGCKKESADTPEIETGSISGKVSLYDDKTNAFANASGVTVSVIGKPEKTVVTSFDGKFTIEGLAFDNYDLSFSKINYGTYKIFGIEHQKKAGTPTGSTSQTLITGIINLGAVSTSSVISLTALDNTYNEQPGIEYVYSLTPTPSNANKGYIRAFLGRDRVVNSSNYQAYSEIKSVINNDAKGGFTAEDLYGLGFNKGDSVYVRLYGESFFSNAYTDPLSRIRIFPNLNAVSAAPIGYVVP